MSDEKAEERSFQLELKLLDSHKDVQQQLITLLLSVPALIALYLSRDYFNQIELLNNYGRLHPILTNAELALIFISIIILAFALSTGMNFIKVNRLKAEKINALINTYHLNVERIEAPAPVFRGRLAGAVIYGGLTFIIFVFTLVLNGTTIALYVYPLIIVVLLMALFRR